MICSNSATKSFVRWDRWPDRENNGQPQVTNFAAISRLVKQVIASAPTNRKMPGNSGFLKTQRPIMDLMYC
jgi:hypothetical protein